LGSSAAAALTLTRPGLGVLGANERIRIGMIGAGGRAQAHLRRLKELSTADSPANVEVAALADVDPAQMKNAAALIGTSPQRFADYRRLLDLKEIDAVFVSTPCHWHAIPALHALAAGKHAFVEKPIGHTIHEGRRITDAAEKSGLVVQIGLQQRSGLHWQEAVRRIREGELGQITNVNVWNVWRTTEMGGQLGNPPDSEPPQGVDYDAWLGPAPKRPFNRARFHGTFYYFFD
jgi:predicted dehydrogenase